VHAKPGHDTVLVEDVLAQGQLPGSFIELEFILANGAIGIFFYVS